MRLVWRKDMHRLLRLIRKGKALIYIVTGKGENVSGEQVMEARAKIKNLEWCLADNISGTSVKRSKKSRSLLSRVPR
jgi:hypothetical protein